MKRWLSIVTLLLASVFAQAQWTTHGFTIPAGHPRLYIPTGSSQYATSQTWLAANPFTVPYCDSNHVFGCMSTAWKHALNASDCSSAITWATGITISTGGVSSDAARWYGEGLVTIYDWCHDQLTPGQLTTLVGSINAWMSFWETAAWGGPTMPYSNYFWGYARNELEWCIASYGENALAAGFCDDALTTRWTNSFLPAAWGPGGVPAEGSEYGRYMMWYPIVPMTSANTLGRDVYGSTGWYKQNVWYTIYTTTPATTYCRSAGGFYYEVYPWGDDQDWYNCNSAKSLFSGSMPGTYYGDVAQTAANYWPSLGVGHYAQQWINTVGLSVLTDYWLRPFSGATTPAAFTSLPLDYYATGMQMLYARTQWGATATTLNIQVNPLISGHQHNDWGNWQMWRNGYWLSRETVGYSETYGGFDGVGTAGSSDSISHNVALINPASQGCAIGTTCYGNGGIDPGLFNGPPVVNRLESQANYTYLEADLTPTIRCNTSAAMNCGAANGHPERDNPAAGSSQVEYVFVRPLETLVVLNRLLSLSPNGGTTPAASIGKSAIIHCETNPTLVDGSHEICTNGTQALYITNLEPTSTTHEAVNEATHSADAYGQYRIEINDPGTTALSYLLNVMQAGSSGGANVTASVVDSNPGDPTSGTFTVTLTPSVGSATTIVFNKGETSSGGTINVAASGVTNLASGVESISYTDNGPVWGGPQPPTGVSGTAVAR